MFARLAYEREREELFNFSPHLGFPPVQGGAKPHLAFFLRHDFCGESRFLRRRPSVRASVTRLRYYLLNIWQFRTMKILLISLKLTNIC